MEAGAAAPSAAVQERVIEPAKGWAFPDFKELWEHRDLLYFMAKRDVAVRYKQAVVGFSWAIVQPLLLAAAFSLFFGVLAKIPAPADVPYPLFAATGIIAWLFIAGGLQNSATSTVQAASLISKVSFPRLVIPIAALAPSTVDFICGFFVVIGVAAAYGFMPQVQLLLAPLLVLLALISILGAGLWLSALNVRYRDVVLLVPFITQIGIFVSPVVYSIDIVPERWQPIYALNPAVGVLEIYRWMVLGSDWPGALPLISIAVSIVLLVTGLLYFRRAEQHFADVI